MRTVSYERAVTLVALAPGVSIFDSSLVLSVIYYKSKEEVLEDLLKERVKLT